MEKWQVVALLGLGAVFMLAAVLLRARYGEKYELKTIDLAVLILPLLFVLLISGKLKMLDAFGVKADFSELFADAAATTIKQQVINTDSPGFDEVLHTPEMAAKGGVREIPQLLEKKTEALLFQLGHGGYYGPAIRQYFDALYASSYLKYVVVVDPSGMLFGVYNALDVAVAFRTQGATAYDDFATWLNRADADARALLARLPGFIAAEQAVGRELSKRDVLRRMDQLSVNSLPVIDSERRFVGTVERSRLTASLILEVADRIAGASNAAP